MMFVLRESRKIGRRDRLECGCTQCLRCQGLRWVWQYFAWWVDVGATASGFKGSGAAYGSCWTEDDDFAYLRRHHGGGLRGVKRMLCKYTVIGVEVCVTIQEAYMYYEQCSIIVLYSTTTQEFE